MIAHAGRSDDDRILARRLFAALLLTAAVAGSAAAQPLHPAESVLDAGEMTAWLRSDALFPASSPVVHADGDWWKLNGRYPKAYPVGVVYTQGLLWGAQVRDGHDPFIRVGGTSYVSGLAPGRILRNREGRAVGADVFDPAKYHVWRVHRDWQTLDYTDAAARFFKKDPAAVTAAERQAVQEQYAYDRAHWPARWGAPYDDVNGDGRYDASVDVPGVPGAAQTLWIVTNDLDSSDVAYGSPPIGIEQQLTVWTHDSPQRGRLERLNAVNFMRARLIYRGRPDTPPDARLDSMFVAIFADPDIGHHTDDFGACDTVRGLAYAFSAIAAEPDYEAFGLAPPAVGWDFLQMPRTRDGAPAGLSMCYVKRTGSSLADPNLGVYDGTLQWYNLMRGRRPRPEYPGGGVFVNPLTGQSTRFTLTGDPIHRTGWIDGIDLPPGSRRLWLASGPFSMSLGDTVEVVVGQIGGLSSSHMASVSHLLVNDDLAQWYVDGEVTTRTAAPVAPPARSGLIAAYPNPFSSSTTLMLTLERPQHVRIAVYDLLGRRVAVLHDGPLAGGSRHFFELDAVGMPSGTYLVQVIGEEGTASRHIVLAK